MIPLKTVNDLMVTGKKLPIINENMNNIVSKENEDEDDYVSVDEETIQKNCENLEIMHID